MSFSADWLALRAAADRAARDPGLEVRLAALLADRPRPLRILDLGAGTGANLAHLAPRLPGPQGWLLADHDPALLARVAAPEGVAVETRAVDLAPGLGALLDPAPDLVTASAFFDLAGAAWADALVRAVAATGAVFYTVLSYDGREHWAPPHPADAEVLAAFHADQHRDKGLGPALGPDATAHLARAFRAAGYQVETAASDWHLSAPADTPLIRALAEGAAAATRPALGPTADDWLAARGGAERVTIGHQDLLAWPA